MSFDLSVHGGRRVFGPAWRLQLAVVGVNVEFHPQFQFATHFGFLPAAITVTQNARFPSVERYRAAGRLSAGFHLDITALGPTAHEDEVAARRNYFEHMKVHAKNAATVDLANMKLEDVGSDKPQALYFSTPAGRSGADYLAQVVAALTQARRARRWSIRKRARRRRAKRSARCGPACYATFSVTTTRW